MNGIFTLEDFKALSLEHGYQIKDPDELQRAYNGLMEQLEGEIRKSMQIALISADNQQSAEIDDITSVKTQNKMLF